MQAAPHAPASMVYLLIVCTHVGALASTFNITGGSLKIVTRTQSMEEKWKRNGRVVWQLWARMQLHMYGFKSLTAGTTACGTKGDGFGSRGRDRTTTRKLTESDSTHALVGNRNSGPTTLRLNGHKLGS